MLIPSSAGVKASLNIVTYCMKLNRKKFNIGSASTAMQKIRSLARAGSESRFRLYSCFDMTLLIVFSILRSVGSRNHFMLSGRLRVKVVCIPSKYSFAETPALSQKKDIIL